MGLSCSASEEFGVADKLNNNIGFYTISDVLGVEGADLDEVTLVLRRKSVEVHQHQQLVTYICIPFLLQFAACYHHASQLLQHQGQH